LNETGRTTKKPTGFWLARYRSVLFQLLFL